MKFDKSKVCVAGLHEVPIGTKGYYSDELQNLEIYVITDHKTMLGKCAGFNCNIRKYDVKGSDMSWRFFYPLPEKQYHPYATIEEAHDVIGKVIHHKLLHRILLITSIEYSDSVKGSEIILINGERADKIFQDYTFKDGSPVGVEV